MQIYCEFSYCAMAMLKFYDKKKDRHYIYNLLNIIHLYMIIFFYNLIAEIEWLAIIKSIM